MFHYLIGGALIVTGLAWMALAYFAAMMSDAPGVGGEGWWWGLVAIALGIAAIWWW